MNKAIFIDRDGVINQSKLIDGKPHAPLNFDNFIILKNVHEALIRIQKKGYKTIVITNQPNLSPKRSTLPISELNKMHKYLKDKFCIDEIYVCPHLESDNCKCRKPKIENIIKAKKKFNLDLGNCFFIGDRYQDVECSQNANLRGCFFIDYGYNESKEKLLNGKYKNYVKVKSLYDISNFI